MRKGKKQAKSLASRIKGHALTTSGNGDTYRKHPTGFHKPGSNKK